jgi:hypothetical protein
MKDRYVADTMAVVLRLEKRRVSMQVKEVFVRAEAGHVESTRKKSREKIDFF